jgi:RHS repeat-associated protein
VLSLSFRATAPNINATVVFTDGSLQEFDNSGWQVRSRLLPQSLKAIEVKGSSVWTGGDNGELYEKVSSTWNYRAHATSGISVKALTNNSGLTIASGNNLYDYTSPALTVNATYTGSAVTVLRSSGSRTLALNASNSVFKKTGATWQAVQTLTQPLFAIHIGSDNTDLLASIMGRVYKGTEGAYGETTIPKVLPLNAVSAGNGNTLVSVGKQGTVITSSDGGVNWTPRYSGTNAELISVAAKGNTMIAGAITGQIIYSTNGGLSWQSATGTTADPVKAIRFSGGNTVLALSGTKILKSTTATPSFITDKVLQATGQGLALDADGYGFVVGDQGLAYRITPGFVYTAIATDDTPEDEKGTGLPNINYTGVTFHDREIGFITAVNGTVLKTIDGGFHWKTLQKSTSAGAPQLAFNNREQGTILQGDGTLGTLSDRSELFGSRFWYDQLGRLTISQNAKQYNIDQYIDNATRQSVTGTGTVRAYSYTLYDHIGRITEVGELLTRQNVPTFKHASQVNYTTLTTAFIAPALTREITKTYYNSAPFLNVYPQFTQENLRPRVASTTYQDKQGSAYDRATHYSYDIHGSVKSLVQEVIVDGTRLAKRIDYDYDLVSGKVNVVTYQKDKEDQLLHKYTYDGDNRITAVQTSKDGIIWDTDAKYQYYAHGPLARVELGEHKVETTDYAYTLQGWIKGTKGENFSYSLGYNNSDYTSIGNSNGLLATPVDKPLYNGNIATMATEIPFFGTQAGQSSRFDQQFSYDQLNRIKSSKQLTGEGYKTSYLYDPNGNIEALTRNDQAGNKIDDFTYNYENKDASYKYNTNKLRSVDDKGTVPASGDLRSDLLDQGIENYEYDDIGNLREDDQEEIAEIKWTVYGKVKAVKRKSGSLKPDLEFNYDASGNRISKKVTNPTTGIINTTFYVRDASGNTMAIYEKATAAALPLLSEQHLYGSQRLGILRPTMMALQTAKHYVGMKEYELNDHLGNVSVTLSDYGVSSVRSAVNYYPFGMMARSYNSGEMRYGYNGKEIDNEGAGGGGATYDYGFRIYNPNIAKFLSVDPLSYSYPWYTPYQFAGNDPINFIDLDGKEKASPEEFQNAMLYNAIEYVDGSPQSSFTKIPRDVFYIALDERLNSFRTQQAAGVNQGSTWLCGIAASMQLLATRYPQEYTKIMIQLYQTGSFTTKGNTYTASDQIKNAETMANSNTVDFSSMNILDYMLLGTIRDNRNDIMSYDPNDDGMYSGGTWPTEISNILKDFGFEVTAQSYYSGLSDDMINKIDKAVNSGKGVILFADHNTLDGHSKNDETTILGDHYVILEKFTYDEKTDKVTFTYVDYGGTQNTRTVSMEKFKSAYRGNWIVDK